MVSRILVRLWGETGAAWASIWLPAVIPFTIRAITVVAPAYMSIIAGYATNWLVIVVTLTMATALVATAAVLDAA